MSERKYGYDAPGGTIEGAKRTLAMMIANVNQAYERGSYLTAAKMLQEAQALQDLIRFKDPGYIGPSLGRPRS